MAVVLLPFLLFVFSVFEFARFVMVRNLVENAAREGCRRAVVNTDVNNNSANLGTTAIQQEVQKMLAGQSLDSLQIKIYLTNASGDAIDGDWTSATYQEGVAVEVSGSYQPLLTGWALGGSIPVKSKSVMNSEGH